jgi:AcrR family transcriptional regulator
VRRIDPVFLKLVEAEPRSWTLRKLEILGAAIRALGAEGAERTTLESVGRRLRISRSHVAYYFGGRKGLLAESFRFSSMCLEELTEQRIREARTPEEQLRAAVSAPFEWAERWPDQARVMLHFHSQCARDRELRKLGTRLRARQLARLRAILSGCLASRTGRSGSPAEELVLGIEAMSAGLLRAYLTTDGEPRAPSLRELAATSAIAWLRAQGARR